MNLSNGPSAEPQRHDGHHGLGLVRGADAEPDERAAVVLRPHRHRRRRLRDARRRPPAGHRDAAGDRLAHPARAEPDARRRRSRSSSRRRSTSCSSMRAATRTRAAPPSRSPRRSRARRRPTPSPSGSSGKTITTLGGQPGHSRAPPTRSRVGRRAASAPTPAPSPVPASGYPGNTTGTFTLALHARARPATLAVNVKQLGDQRRRRHGRRHRRPEQHRRVSGHDRRERERHASPSRGLGLHGHGDEGRPDAPNDDGGRSPSARRRTSRSRCRPPPTGTLVVNVNWDSALPAARTASRSPAARSRSRVTGSTNASGQVTFTNVPAAPATRSRRPRTRYSGTATATVTAARRRPVTCQPADGIGAGDRHRGYGGVRLRSTARDDQRRPLRPHRRLEHHDHGSGTAHERPRRLRLHDHRVEGRADHDRRRSRCPSRRVDDQRARSPCRSARST